VTFPFGNLFNYNFFSWVVFNIEEYIRNMFEFTLLMTVSGVGIGYFFVLITDLAFHAYYKVTKKTLIRKIKGYEWASQEEVKIKDAFDAIQKKITRTQKKKDGKGTATFLIFLVTCTAFFTIKIAISQTGSIHVKFSPNFITLGDFDPLNGSVVITGLSVISAPLSREQLMFSWLQGLLTPDIILSLSYVYGTHHFMLMSYQFMGGMDFTFHTPKDNNIYAVLVTYRFKYNLTEQWIETGNSFFVNYFSSSVVPKSITIDAIYIANYTPSTNVTSGAVRSSLLLGNVQDSWLHLYDYLLYW
jgi:hypothetical protein